MLSKFATARYFFLALFGIGALGELAIFAYDRYLANAGADGLGIAFVDIVFNASWILLFLLVSTFLTTLRWRTVQSTPIRAAFAFALVTSPVSFVLDLLILSWQGSSGSTIFVQVFYIAMTLGLATIASLFGIVGWLLYVSAKQKGVVANFGLFGALCLVVILPICAVTLFPGLPWIWRSSWWIETNTIARTDGLSPLANLVPVQNVGMDPACLTVGADSTVFVAMAAPNVIVAYPWNTTRATIAAVVNTVRMARGSLSAITVDSHGDLYVMDRTMRTIFEYATAPAGKLKLKRRIALAGVNISNASGLAVGPSGRVYWLARDVIEVLSPATAGSAARHETISGPRTLLSREHRHLRGPVVDAAGNVYVAASDLNVGGKMTDHIYVFGLSARGDVHPDRVIEGAKTDLGGPVDFANDLAIGPTGNLFVLGTNPLRIMEFARGAQGNVAPIRIRDVPDARNFPDSCCLGFAPDGLTPDGTFYLGDRSRRSISVFTATKSDRARVNAERVVKASRTGERQASEVVRIPPNWGRLTMHDDKFRGSSVHAHVAANRVSPRSK